MVWCCDRNAGFGFKAGLTLLVLFARVAFESCSFRNGRFVDDVAFSIPNTPESRVGLCALGSYLFSYSGTRFLAANTRCSCLRHPQIQQLQGSLSIEPLRRFSTPSTNSFPSTTQYTPRPTAKSGLIPTVKMVQYYNVAGAKVGSHYVSARAPLPDCLRPRSSNQAIPKSN